MRLIDADALKVYHGVNVGADHGGLRAVVYKKDIDTAPTIDAVPVVRCKDCKHKEDEALGMVYCPNSVGGWVTNNFFCAFGEKRGDRNGTV